VGSVVKAIGSILGGGVKPPKADVAPAIGQVDEETEKNKRARGALINTASQGATLQPGQVQAGSSLFGN
jgi:hypothetical protein